MVQTAQTPTGLIQKIARKYKLRLLLLFGSRAEGESHSESDFDVAYLANRDLNLEQEARLIIELAPVFKSENIDLVNLRRAPPLLFYAIMNKCQVMYEKDPLIFATMRAYSFKKYVETKPLYELKFQRLRDKIGRTGRS
ncbi:MAG: nucleotidyltransferase domain-containing protein [Chloroflexi bacterium]|nr:nucleotidyltransferase domain-containing protein [Chloroflexota bacterium]